MLVCEYFMRLPAGRQESTNGMRLPASGWNAANELDDWSLLPTTHNLQPDYGFWYLVLSILPTVDSRLKSVP